MTIAPYNISEEELQLVLAWPTSPSKPALFLTVPSVRDVGERDLVRDLSTIAIRDAGLRDAPARHRLWRNYPHDGSPGDYARFMDDPILTAEIGNEFLGVDCIDLTGWLGKDLESPNWVRLLAYVRPDSKCGYVFVAYTDRTDSVIELAQSIVTRCGVAVLHASLLVPTTEAFTEFFADRTDSLFKDDLDLVWNWIEELRKSNRTPNYAYVSTVATMASYSVDLWKDRRAGLFQLLEQHTALAPTACKTRHIGF